MDSNKDRAEGAVTRSRARSRRRSARSPTIRRWKAKVAEKKSAERFRRRSATSKRKSVA